MIEERDIPCKSDDDRKSRAISELRTLELFYLTLTVLSPFIGATLLKFVAVSITGDPNTLSWFSTSLFILATGIRPWSHLVDRLKDRSQALRTIVEEVDEESPDADLSSAAKDDDKHQKTMNELARLKRQMQALESRLADVSVMHAQEWDDIAESIVGVESEGRKFNNEALKRAETWNKRMDVLEACVRGLQEHALRLQQAQQGAAVNAQRKSLPGYVWSFVVLPWTLTVLCWRTAWGVISAPFSPIYPRDKESLPKSRQSEPLLGPLATIVEEPEIQLQDSPLPIASLPTNESDDTIVGIPLDERPLKTQQQHSSLMLTTTVDIPNILFHPISVVLYFVALLVSIPRRVVNSVLSVSGA